MSHGLRIVVCLTSRSWGGNEKWAAEAARGLKDRGHVVTLLWSHESVLLELEKRGLRSRRILLRGDLDLIGFAALVSVFRSERPDVVILTKQREYWLGGLAARLAGRPLVVFRLGLRRMLRNDIKRRTSFGKLADLIIVNSSSVRDALLESPWVDPERVSVIVNAVELDAVAECVGRSILESLGIPEGALVVCGVGRLTHQKGFDVLMGAFALVRSRVPTARLVIVGEGGQRSALEKAAVRLGVSDSVLFAGHREDVRELLSGVNVYVLSSRNEGMANTLLEAMSVGAPIVAANVSGTSEAVIDGREALIVPPEDEEAIASAVVRLLTDRALADSLGRAARAAAETRFESERMQRELEVLLTSSLERRRSGGKTSGAFRGRS